MENQENIISKVSEYLAEENIKANRNFKTIFGKNEQELMRYFISFYSQLSEKIIGGTVCHIEGNKLEIVILNKLLYLSFSSNKAVLGFTYHDDSYHTATLEVKEYKDNRYRSDPEKNYLNGKKMGAEPYSSKQDIRKFDFELINIEDELKWQYINQNNHRFKMDDHVFLHIISTIFKD